MAVQHRVSQTGEVEEALRQSEQCFSKAFHISPVATAITRVRDGRFVDANDSYLRLVGYSREEIVNRTSLDLGLWVNLDDRQRLMQMIQEKQTVRDLEGTVHTKSGEMRDAVCSFVGIELDGEPCILGMARDITEQKRAEEALKGSEERFRAIVENAPFGYYRVGNDGLWQYVNPVWERMHGYSAKDVIGKRFEITQTGEDVEAARQLVERVLTGETLTGEFSRATRQGTTEYHTFSIQPVRQGNEIVAIEGFINDITGRRRAEEHFSKTFHASPLAIVMATLSEGRIVDANEGFLQLIGYRREEVIGRSSLELGMWIDPKEREWIVQEVLKAGSVPNWELRMRTKAGKARVWLTAFVTIELDGVPCLLGMSRDVTEHRQAEDALRESEKRLASIYDTVGDVIFLLDVEKDGGYRFTSVNHAFLSVTGLPAEAVVGKRVTDVIPEPSLTLVLGKYRQAVQKKAIVRWEETSDYPAGRLTGEVSVMPVFDEGGNCTHLVGTVHDITERKRADEALRESERRFRQVLDVSSDMIFKLDLEFDTFDYISPSVLEMTGFTREEVIAMGPHGLRRRIHPKDRPEFKRGSEEFVELGSHPGFEYRWQCKDGQYRWFDEGRTLVRDTEGRPVAVVGAIRDVTERRVREEALRKSEELFRTLSASAPVGIFLMMDDKGQVIYANKRLQAIAGVPPGGGPMEELATAVHPDDRERVIAEWVKAAEEHAELSQEFRILTAQGETRWVHLRARPIFAADGSRSSVVGTVEDTTERRQAEERDRQQRAEHVRANELRHMVRVLEQMSATLAHELRNPLGVISNSAYFLANQAGIDDPKVEKHAEIIGREVASAKRVIDDILEFAHVPEILPSPASLNAIVDQALARSQVPANIRVARKLALDLPPLVCDEERLERGFLDVITNAVQAMPHGGRLSVKTRQSADSVEAVFSDTGEGIAPQNLAKIFDPMFTTKMRGIGLGLTVVRRTVEQHGGRVDVRSVLGHGATVTIVLPVDCRSAKSNDEAFATRPCQRGA